MRPMKILLRPVITVILLLVVLSAAYSVPEGVNFSIRFYNKQIYYPDSNIRIKIEIANETADSYQFKLADLHVFNIDFDVRTLTNRKINHSKQFTIERNSDQPVFFREITLAPGEHYSFIENLQDYIKLENPGTYIIKGIFYPKLARSTSEKSIKSNQLTLSIHPQAGMPEIEARIEEKTGEIMQKNSMSPDNVVTYMLNARQNNNWQKFFLYVDVESLLLKDASRRRRFNRLSQEEQLAMIEDFREQMKQQRVDTDILVVPTDFTIEKTTYTPQYGNVIVREEFKYPDYTQIKEYTYYLENRNNIWYIYDYEVQNVGTE